MATKDGKIGISEVAKFNEKLKEGRRLLKAKKEQMSSPLDVLELRKVVDSLEISLKLSKTAILDLEHIDNQTFHRGRVSALEECLSQLNYIMKRENNE